MPECLKCDEFGQKCLECSFHYEINPNQDGCVEIKGDLLRAIAYYDELDQSINLVYDEQIKAQELTRLTFKLFKKETTTSARRRVVQSAGVELKVKKIKIPKGEKRIKAKLELPSEKLQDASIRVETTDLKGIKSKGSKDVNAFDSSFPLDVNRVNKHSGSGVNVFKYLGHFLALALFISSVILLFISLPMVVVITQFLQIVDNIKLFRQELPVSTRAFIQPFRRGFMGSIFSPVDLSEGTTKCHLSDVLMKREMSCLLFNSSAGAAIFDITIILVFLKILVKIILCLKKPKGWQASQGQQQKPSCFMKGVNKVNKFLSTRFFYYFALAFQIDVLVASFVSIRYGDRSKAGSTLDYMISIILVLMYATLLGVSVFGGLKAYKKRKGENGVVARPSSIFNDNVQSANRKLNEKSDRQIKKKIPGSKKEQLLDTPIKKQRSNQDKLGSDEDDMDLETAFMEKEKQNGAFMRIFCDDFDGEKPIGCLFLPFNALIGFILSFALVFPSSLWGQLISFFILIILLEIFAAKIKPSKQLYKRVKNLYVITGGFFIAVFVLLLISWILENDTSKVLSSSTYKNLGYLVTLLLILPSTILLFTSVMTIIGARKGTGAVKEDVKEVKRMPVKEELKKTNKKGRKKKEKKEEVVMNPFDDANVKQDEEKKGINLADLKKKNKKKNRRQIEEVL